MINRKEDSIEYLGITFIIVLCFILFSASRAFHQNSYKPDYSPSYQVTTTQLTPAVTSNSPFEFYSHNKFLSLDDKINFRFFNEYLKIKIHNKLIIQKIGLRHEIVLLIKPSTYIRYYNLPLILFTDDLPVLS